MEKRELYKIAERWQGEFVTSCRTIWNNPEAGGTEERSSAYFRALFAAHGFAVTVDEHLPYAFCAEYGSGRPVIAILGEYDALPGLSQKVEAVPSPVRPGAPGHGCGHNLLGSASALAAVTVKEYLEASGTPGTVRFYGCPEEELLSGKVKMAYYRMFDGCDLAVNWHPMAGNLVFDSGYLANASVHFHFHGVSSHAAFAPEKGRSALDAVELMNVGVNYLREHVNSAARIHYTTDSGGFMPNIVPPEASAWYYIRAPHISDVREILERIKKIAQGACLMTETTVDIKLDYGCCEMLENNAFGTLAYQNLLAAPQPVFSEAEYRFAREIESTLDAETVAQARAYYGTDQPLSSGVMDRNQYKVSPMTASSDSGDVSYIMPMCAFSTTCWPIAVAPHTWQSCACAGSTIGEKGAFYAAQVMAGIAYDLFNRPELRAEILDEFERKRKPYAPMYEP